MKLLTKKETADQLGVHAETVMRYVREGRFPRPLKMGGGHSGHVRFVESEVHNWVASRLAEVQP